MSQTVKLSQEELQTITENQQRITQLTFAVGQVEIQKQRLFKELEEAQVVQDAFGTTLFEKYGDGTINLDSGELTLTEQETPESAE